MNAAWRAALFGLLLTGFGILSGCAVSDGGGGYGGSVGIGADYYEPYYGDYGGWGPGYLVGPHRGDDRPRDRGGLAPSPRAYHPAAGNRSAPSIPSGARSGGGGRAGNSRR